MIKVNDLLEAAKKKDSSEDRYEKLKKDEAGTESSDPVEERYNELKEKAKKEYRKQLEEEEDKDKEDDGEESFLTY